MSKCVIKRNFARGARHYDKHSSVQKECAEKLLELVGEGSRSRILEIGCGTGVYTSLLGEKFSGTEITAVDISRSMIGLAKKKVPGRNVRFVVDDGECMPLEGKFDLITSNAAFQWFENLDAAFGSFSEGLRENGMLCFSMYGPGTFKEFQEVLGAHFGIERQLSSGKFISPGTLKSILKQHFDDVVLEEEYFKADFDSLWDFLQDIKRSGTRGYGLSNGIFIGKGVLKELEKMYIEKFGKITATHHVYFGRGCMSSRARL